MAHVSGARCSRSGFADGEKSCEAVLGLISEHLPCEPDHDKTGGKRGIVTFTVTFEVLLPRVPATTVSLRDEPPPGDVGVNRGCRRRIGEGNLSLERGDGRVGQQPIEEAFQLAGWRLVRIIGAR